MATSTPFTTATTPSQTPPQQHMYQNQRPANPNHSQGQAQGQGVVYPVASSGRGFIPKPMRPSDQTVTVANHGGYPPRPNQLPPYPRPHLDNHHHPVLHHHQHHHMIRPPPLNNQQHQHPQISSNPSPIRGVPVSSGHLKVLFFFFLWSLSFLMNRRMSKFLISFMTTKYCHVVQLFKFNL